MQKPRRWVVAVAGVPVVLGLALVLAARPPATIDLRAGDESATSNEPDTSSEPVPPPSSTSSAGDGSGSQSRTTSPQLGGAGAQAAVPGRVGFVGDPSSLTVIDGSGPTPAGTYWRDGDLVVGRDGVVLDGVRVAGSVSLEADGTLTIRNSVIEATSGWRLLYGVGESCHLDVQDSTLRFVGTPDNGSGGIHGDCTLTARRNDISGSADGIQNGPGNSTIEGNWIHDLAATRDFHNDGIQFYSGSGIVVRDNRIDIGWNGTNQNAAIFFQGTFDAPVIEGNHLSGGGFTLRLEEGVRGAVVRDNVIVTAPQAFGPVLVGAGAAATWRNNVDGSGRRVSP